MREWNTGGHLPVHNSFCSEFPILLIAKSVRSIEILPPNPTCAYIRAVSLMNLRGQLVRASLISIPFAYSLSIQSFIFAPKKRRRSNSVGLPPCRRVRRYCPASLRDLTYDSLRSSSEEHGHDLIQFIFPTLPTLPSNCQGKSSHSHNIFCLKHPPCRN